MTGFRSRSYLFLCVGLVIMTVLSVKHRRDVWNPLILPVSATAEFSAVGSIEITEKGDYELQVEIDRTIDPTVIRKLITNEDASPLGLEWTISKNGKAISMGDAKDYLYIAPGPRSKKALLRRILLRVPFDQNDEHWRSFGLAGSTTVARGLSRFSANPGDVMEVQASFVKSHPELTLANPNVVVRKSRRNWQQHYDSYSVLGYIGLLSAAVGILMLIASLLNRRG